MLRRISARRCPRCGGGPLARSADAAERLYCLACGWRAYADRFPRAVGKGEVLVDLPYMGAESDAMRLRLVVAEVIDGAAKSSLSVRCPFCAPPSARMECVNVTRQYWHCEAGHSIRLTVRGGEYVGWA